MLISAEEMTDAERSTKEITECFNASTARLTMFIMEKITENEERLADMTVALMLATKFVTTEFLTASFPNHQEMPTEPRNFMYYLEQCLAQLSAQYKIEENKNADLSKV